MRVVTTAGVPSRHRVMGFLVAKSPCTDASFEGTRVASPFAYFSRQARTLPQVETDYTTARQYGQQGCRAGRAAVEEYAVKIPLNTYPLGMRKRNPAGWSSGVFG